MSFDDNQFDSDTLKEGRLVQIKQKYDHGKYGVIVKVLSSSIGRDWTEFCYMILTDEGTFCYASKSSIDGI